MIDCTTEFLGENQAFHGSIPLAMGTRLEMVVTGSPKDRVMPLWDWLCVEISYLESVLDRFREDSEIARVNASACGPGVKVSPLLASLVRLAQGYWKSTGGLFDVTKGGMGEIALDEDGCLALGGHVLDFGGFAKGYVLREFRDRALLHGIGSAFVDFGGSSILAIGRHPHGDCWKVGVRNPFGGSVLKEVDLRDQSLSTSGNAPGYSGHIVNPLTGGMVTGRKVVTVVSDDPLEAEILSTAAMVAGDEGLKALAEAFPRSTIERLP